jgi:hypothetical protein
MDHRVDCVNAGRFEIAGQKSINLIIAAIADDVPAVDAP